jgi:hypothetical protein
MAGGSSAMKTLSVFYSKKDGFSLSARKIATLALAIVSMASFLIPAAFADKVLDAKIAETISVYIPDEGTSMLLVTGMPAQVLAIDGDNAVISLKLQNGFYVQAQVPTKYLKISPPKQNSSPAFGLAGPNPVIASPIEPPVLPKTDASLVAATEEFYKLEEVTFHQSAVQGEPQGTKAVPQLDDNNQPVLDEKKEPVMKQVPIPFLAVHVSVKAQVSADTVLAKAYFYDENRQLIASDSSPSMTDWSVFIPQDKPQFIRFDIPDKVSLQSNWSAVVVFGDAKGVVAQCFPVIGQESYYDFPEKNILGDKSGPPIERKVAMDPLTEHVVKTENPDQPQITLFMRPPLGMTDASEAKGVMCLSVLAWDVDGVKRQLQKGSEEENADVTNMLKFADEHKLIIICWGSHGLWDPQKNWDDLDPNTARATDKAFDQVAKAWADGVQYFVKEYGIPSNGYLLWGQSGAAQYACRLALRKPDYFLAMHMHVPSSFDKPTPEGRKVLWCLTTGERESGYQRSLRFYAQCRALGYPMIYKAIVGLGHATSPIADDIGLKFFDYALSMRDQRLAYDASLNDPLKQSEMAQADNGQVQVWLESFRKPAYVGDAVNQGVFPYAQQDNVPPGFWVPLPTKEIAEAWNH